LQSFKALNYGYSAALSYLVAFIILALVIIYARLIKVEGTQ
jgi:ABC-type sugar transport system permease subunit